MDAIQRIHTDRTFDLSAAFEQATATTKLALQAAERALPLEVVDPPSRDKAVSVIRGLRALADEWEEARDRETKPLDDLIEEVSGKVREVRDAIYDRHTQPIQALRAVAAMMKERVEEYAERERAAIAALPGLAPEQVVEVAAAVSQPMEGAHMRSNWKAEVTDASLVPREYLCPDMRLLSRTAKRTKGTLEIPGVRIYNDQTLVVKS